MISSCGKNKGSHRNEFKLILAEYNLMMENYKLLISFYPKHQYKKNVNNVI